jgi:two-component system CheB/CheR fusion protein
MYDDSNQVYSILVFGYEVTQQVIAKNKILEITQLHEQELQEKIAFSTLELKQANESLLQKNDELLKVNKDLESFNYISSHDLQEPLRKIQTFINRILEKEYAGLSEKGKDYFNKIKEAGIRMQTLIEDLLVYSHTSFGEWTFEDTPLEKIISGVIIDLADNIKEKNAVIEFSQLGSASVNPLQFRQLFQNLVANALKFSKVGIAPHILIKSEIALGKQFPEKNLLPGKDYCHILFADNGIGFDSKYKDQIFEVFQRLHGREEYAGTGIGLAIVKKIVEKHNGFISAESVPGKGATFNIYIPAL